MEFRTGVEWDSNWDAMLDYMVENYEKNRKASVAASDPSGVTSSDEIHSEPNECPNDTEEN
jgi:hypothetical protein